MNAAKLENPSLLFHKFLFLVKNLVPILTTIQPQQPVVQSEFCCVMLVAVIYFLLVSYPLCCHHKQ